MLASDVWTEADIKTRLHALIRTEFSAEVEEELSRAIMGVSLGQHTLTTDEMIKLGKFKALTDRVALIGTQSRADWALLSQVMAHEQAMREAQHAYDAAIALQVVAEDATPQVIEAADAVIVPALVLPPVEGDAIYEVWLARNPPVIEEPAPPGTPPI